MEQPPSTPQPTEQPLLQTTQAQTATTTSAVTSASSSLPPPTTTPSFPNPNPTPSPKPPTPPPSQQSNNSQTRPPFNTRPWQQPPHSHFSLPSPPMPASSASTSSSISAPPPPRGGMAIGVLAHNPSTGPPPPASFSSLTSPSYGQQSQIRPPVQGMGMTGSLGATSSMRPAGVPSNQLRPSQSSLRPQSSSSSQSPAAQVPNILDINSEREKNKLSNTAISFIIRVLFDNSVVSNYLVNTKSEASLMGRGLKFSPYFWEFVSASVSIEMFYLELLKILDSEDLM